MTERVQPTDLELAALISSKICHDVIGPISAINNGLEIFDEEEDAQSKNYALDVIRNVTETASARLQFARFAFGASGSAGAQIDLGNAENLCRGFIGETKDTTGRQKPSKHKLIWRGIPGTMAKDKVKLLLNLIAQAPTAIPRGGDIEVNITGTPRNAELRGAVPWRRRPAAPVPGRFRQRSHAADRCHVDPGLLHAAAGGVLAHAACRGQGRRRHAADGQARAVGPCCGCGQRCGKAILTLLTDLPEAVASGRNAAGAARFARGAVQG